MLDYYVDIAGESEPSITVHYGKNGDGVHVAIRQIDNSIRLDKQQLEKLLTEYDRFLQACKCVEVV